MADNFEKVRNTYARLSDDLAMEGLARDHCQTKGSGFSGQYGDLSVQSLRARDLLEGQIDQRVTTQRTPYAGIVVKNPEPNMDVLVGEFQRVWEQIKDQAPLEVEWTIEVQVCLSPERRNRVLSVALLTPYLLKPDMTVRSVARHLENMRERNQKASFCLCRWFRFLEEPDERFNDEDIPERQRDANITVDGALRLVYDAAETSLGAYTVSGDPVVRLSLDRAAGLVLRASQLDQGLYRELFRSWLRDYVDFTSGDGRNYRWDTNTQSYISQSPEHDPRAHQDLPSVRELLKQ